MKFEIRSLETVSAISRFFSPEKKCEASALKPIENPIANSWVRKEDVGYDIGIQHAECRILWFFGVVDRVVDRTFVWSTAPVLWWCSGCVLVFVLVWSTAWSTTRLCGQPRGCCGGVLLAF